MIINHSIEIYCLSHRLINDYYVQWYEPADFSRIKLNLLILQSFCVNNEHISINLPIIYFDFGLFVHNIKYYKCIKSIFTADGNKNYYYNKYNDFSELKKF